MLTVKKAQQIGFSFTKDLIIVGLDGIVSNDTTGGSGTGTTISYSIDNTSVATIDANGYLNLISTGTAIITATKAGDNNYLATSATYMLKVTKPLTTLGIKNIKFDWQDFATATHHYRLQSDLGGTGYVDASTIGFVVLPNSTNITQTNVRADISLHRYVPLVNGPKYQVEACDAGNTCSDDPVAKASLSNDDLNKLIGFFKASNTGANDQFGNSVSLSDDGNTLAVGAHLEDSNSTGVGRAESSNNADESGAVYIFTRSTVTATWSQQAYIKASNADRFGKDRFGFSLSISDDGNTLAVGAPGEDSNSTGVNGLEENNLSSAGAAYLFIRDNNSQWTQKAYIKASNTGRSDQFGKSLSLSGDGNTLAVGAWQEDSNSTGVNSDEQNNNSAGDSGAVYVFAHSTVTETWSQQAYIKASNTDILSFGGDLFGSSVSISDDGNTLAVSAHSEDSSATGVDGEQNNNDSDDSGAVYIFTRINGTWSQQAYIKTSDTDAFDQFGSSVSLSGDGNTLAVGAIGEDSSATGVGGAQGNLKTGYEAGAVYVFTRSSDNWSQQAYIKASNTGEQDQFGKSVSLSDDGNTLAVSAWREDSNAKGVDGNQDDSDNGSDSGATYVFTRSGEDWSQQAYIKASNTGAGDGFDDAAIGRLSDDFGRTPVSLSGDGNTLAVGAPFEDSNSTGVSAVQNNDDSSNSGAVYLY